MNNIPVGGKPNHQGYKYIPGIIGLAPAAVARVAIDEFGGDSG